jgi:hypothetical protein
LNLPQERDLLKNHPHSKPNPSSPPSKPDISTLRGFGHFYFALTGKNLAAMWNNKAARCRAASKTIDMQSTAAAP